MDGKAPKSGDKVVSAFKIPTLEQALAVVWSFCNNADGRDRVRKALERGVEEIEYKIRIQRDQDGMLSVRVAYRESNLAQTLMRLHDLL